MVNVKLPDGSVRPFEAPPSVLDVAAAIGPGLAKAALGGKVDGRLVDLSHVIDRDAALEIATEKSPEALDMIRHSTAHLMAQATQRLFPDTQVTIGPVIENGFFYDFARKVPFTPDDHIFIRDFRLQTLIGFHRRERVVPQTIRLDLEIGIANAAVFTSDKVADCIDYDKVTARIREIASQHVNLVETLAERVARLLLDEFGAASAKVSIAKLGILKDVGLVGVTVERRRT